MAQTSARSQLMVLVFTDIVDSVAMKRRLGDAEFYRLLNWHNGLFEEALSRVEDAQVIKMTGDGFLARFPSASAAVQASLVFQAMMADQPRGPESVVVRTGVHVGEAMEVSGVRGQPDVIGLAVDTAARIMSLAMPGQILLTRTAFDDARQYIRLAAQTAAASGSSSTEVTDTRWLAHGAYMIKGTDEPMEVYEVGTIGKAPLRAPPDSDKAKRAVRADEAELLGWRPAPRIKVPGRPAWLIQRKLGEGGFGEVWLATHEKTREHRVLKFCFDAERLRFLRRELTIFRVLRESLGDRQDIVRIHDVRLDQPPYYLESAYSEAGNLIDWSESLGGLMIVALEDRIEIIARIADAVAAAHGVGVLHKDLKPANILMYNSEGRLRPQLADFGIGMLSESAMSSGKQITMAGFTMGASSSGASSSTGTPLYMAPEVLAGGPFTTQADVYALGVMLYQMAAGNLKKPIGHGWERDVPDPELRDDIRRAVSADLKDRFTSATSLARNLRERGNRRRVRVRRRALRLAAVTAVVAAIAGTGTTLVMAKMHEAALEKQQRVAAEANEKDAKRKTLKAEHLAGLLETILRAPDPRTGRSQTKSPMVILDAARETIEKAQLKEFPEEDFRAGILVVRAYLGLSEPLPAMKLAELLLEHAAQAWPGSRHHAEALHWYGYAHRSLSNEVIARQRFSEAEAIWTALGERHLKDLAESMYERGVAERTVNELAMAEQTFRRSMAIREPLATTDKDIRLELARSYNSMARLFQERNDFVEARQWAQRSLDFRTRDLEKGHRDIARAKTTLGQLFYDCGRTEEAMACFKDAAEDMKNALGEDSPEYAGALVDLCLTRLTRTGEPLEETRAMADEALVIRRAEHDKNGRQAKNNALADALVVSSLAELAGRTPELAKVVSNLREALEIHKRRYPKPDAWQPAFAKFALAKSLLAIGANEEAHRLLFEAADFWSKTKRSPVRTQMVTSLAIAEADRVLKAQPDPDFVTRRNEWIAAHETARSTDQAVGGR